VFLCARVDDASVGGDDLCRRQVVAGQAVAAQEPAHSAAEREAADAGGGDEATGHGEVEGLGLVVEVAPGHPGLGGHPAPYRIDEGALHRRQIDDDAALAGGEPGDAVSAAAHGDEQVLAARELDGADHVRRPGAAHDQGRMLVVCGVPDRAGPVVGGVAGAYDGAAQVRLEFGEGGVAQDAWIVSVDMVGSSGCVLALIPRTVGSGS
jgi:hypothetical protein